AQPRGEIDHGADRRIVEAALESDPTERRIAVRDADPEAELVAVLAPADAELADALAHLDRKPHRALARVRTRQRIIEQDHYAVADEALDRALVFVDQRAEAGVIFAQDLHHLLGLCRL